MGVNLAILRESGLFGMDIYKWPEIKLLVTSNIRGYKDHDLNHPVLGFDCMSKHASSRAEIREVYYKNESMLGKSTMSTYFW